MKYGMVLLLALAMGTVSSAAMAQTYYHYECDGGARFELALYADTRAAYLQLDGKSILLPKRFSLISQRFKKGGVSLAMRAGGKALLKRGDGKTVQCQAR
jgi:hypothetical protein